ncbi:MAG: ATP-binding domain-containing protein [Rhodoferax sp.]|nr:ATP-binding domain-containing protein [Rhodoferax sp.]
MGGVRRDAELRADVNRWQPYCRSYGSAKEVRDAIVAQNSAAVVTSTIHAAKGGQWDHVFIVGATEGLLPIHFARDQRMLAEERNLLYVAISRARESVRLYHAPTHITRTGDFATDVSSFLDAPAVQNLVEEGAELTFVVRQKLGVNFGIPLTATSGCHPRRFMMRAMVLRWQFGRRLMLHQTCSGQWETGAGVSWLQVCTFCHLLGAASDWQREWVRVLRVPAWGQIWVLHDDSTTCRHHCTPVSLQ